MQKKISSILFVATLLFIASTFITSSFQASNAIKDTFGFPFVFFQGSSSYYGEENRFFVGALLADISIYIGLSFVIIKIITAIKLIGQKNRSMAS